eukprot:jgi/Mesen1/10028/ME000073S09307
MVAVAAAEVAAVAAAERVIVASGVAEGGGGGGGGKVGAADGSGVGGGGESGGVGEQQQQQLQQPQGGSGGEGTIMGRVSGDALLPNGPMLRLQQDRHHEPVVRRQVAAQSEPSRSESAGERGGSQQHKAREGALGQGKGAGVGAHEESEGGGGGVGVAGAAATAAGAVAAGDKSRRVAGVVSYESYDELRKHQVLVKAQLRKSQQEARDWLSIQQQRQQMRLKERQKQEERELLRLQQAEVQMWEKEEGVDEGPVAAHLAAVVRQPQQLEQLLQPPPHEAAVLSLTAVPEPRGATGAVDSQALGGHTPAAGRHDQPRLSNVPPAAAGVQVAAAAVAAGDRAARSEVARGSDAATLQLPALSRGVSLGERRQQQSFRTQQPVNAALSCLRSQGRGRKRRLGAESAPSAAEAGQLLNPPEASPATSLPPVVLAVAQREQQRAGVPGARTPSPLEGASPSVAPTRIALEGHRAAAAGLIATHALQPSEAMPSGANAVSSFNRATPAQIAPPASATALAGQASASQIPGEGTGIGTLTGGINEMPGGMLAQLTIVPGSLGGEHPASSAPAAVGSTRAGLLVPVQAVPRGPQPSPPLPPPPPLRAQIDAAFYRHLASLPRPLEPLEAEELRLKCYIDGALREVAFMDAAFEERISQMRAALEENITQLRAAHAIAKEQKEIQVRQQLEALREYKRYVESHRWLADAVRDRSLLQHGPPPSAVVQPIAPPLPARSPV